MKYLKILYIVLFALLLSCNNTQKSEEPFLADTDSWIMLSEITGRKYQISVALPEKYASTDSSYSVLYGMDANMEFGTLVESARNLATEGLIRDLIVVGIGYPVGQGWRNTLPPRSLDLTPTADPGWMADFNRKLEQFNWPPLRGTGDAENFVAVLQQEIISSVEKKYRANRENRGFYGHSFGGLFGLYILFHNEGLFNRFIIGSPSLFWDDGVIFSYEAEYASQQRTLASRVFLSIGLLEEDPSDPGKDAMVTNMKKMIEVLERRQYKDFQLETYFFPDETHLSVVPATISRGLRSVYLEKPLQ